MISSCTRSFLPLYSVVEFYCLVMYVCTMYFYMYINTSSSTIQILYTIVVVYDVYGAVSMISLLAGVGSQDYVCSSSLLPSSNEDDV
jgi:hypothetical protein